VRGAALPPSCAAHGAHAHAHRALLPLPLPLPLRRGCTPARWRRCAGVAPPGCRVFLGASVGLLLSRARPTNAEAAATWRGGEGAATDARPLPSSSLLGVTPRE
jgi:hypothetical protein